MNPRIVTAAEQPAVSLDDLKSHIAIDGLEADRRVQGYIDAAVGYVEELCDRSLITKTYAWTLDGFGASRYPADDFWFEKYPTGDRCLPLLKLPRPPLIAVTSIEYVDTAGATQTLDPSAYYVDTINEPARITPVNGTPWPQTMHRPNTVTVTYTAGYGVEYSTVPGQIRHAIAMLVGHMDRNPEATAAVSLSRVPFGVAELLTPFRSYAR